MTGLVCLQGGAEFGPDCAPMDAEVLRRVGLGRTRVRVVVSALAGAPGREVQTAQAHGVAYYRGLDADVVGAPDAREDPDGAMGVLATADLLVLPGGSPARLLDALRQTPVGSWLVEALGAGLAVSGSSAGAMVLCDWTVLPERPGPHGVDVVPGLGVVVDTVVLPHWSGAGRTDWLQAIAAAVPGGTQVLGLPEQSGVLVSDGALMAVGAAPVHLFAEGRDLAPDELYRKGPQEPRAAS